MARFFNNTTADYLEIADQTYLNFNATESGAWACWLRLEATGATGRRALAKKDSAAAADAGWHLNKDTADKLNATVSDGTNTATASDPTAISAGVWYHFLAIFRRGTANTLKLYRDGVEVGSASVSAVGSLNNTRPYRVGANSAATPGNPWYGRIAHAVVWEEIPSTDWTDGDVELLKQSRWGPVLGDNIEEWNPIGLGSPDVDYSGHANNAVVNGTTLADGPPIGPYRRYSADGYWAAMAAAAAKKRRMLLGVGR